MAVIPTTKTLLLKIFVNIIRTQMQLPALHAISLMVFGHWIYLTQMNLCVINTLGSAPRTPSCMQRSYLLSITKLLLDSAHDAMPIYEYCKRTNIVSFIDLNEKHGIHVKYKNDFTIGKDGIPVCKEGHLLNHDGCNPSKHRLKFKCPLINVHRQLC